MAIVSGIHDGLALITGTAQDASTLNGDSFTDIHQLSWIAFILEHTLGSPGAGDTLDVKLQFSLDATTWFDFAAFAQITTPTVPTQRQMYQWNRTQHTAALVTNAQITATTAAGTDKIGTAAGDLFPIRYMRAVGVVVGATSFTYTVKLYGSNA
jgi:hypothetical protein